MTDKKQNEIELSEQTRQLFDAPWKVTEYCSGTVTVRTQKDFICRRTNDEKGRKYINRIARLPELYDALMDAAKSYCQAADFDCPKKYCAWCSAGKCKALKWLDLLRKVRDGK